MPNRKGLPTLFFLLLLTTFGLGYFRFKIGPTLNQPPAPLPSPSPKMVATASAKPVAASPSAEVIGAVAELNSRQKVAQLLAFPVLITNSKEPVASASSNWVTGEQPGFVSLFGTKISTTSAKIATDELRTKSEHALPVLFAVDHEGGQVQRLAGTGFTALPSWSEVCNLPPEQRQTVLQESAAQLAAAGVNIVYGPVTDTATGSATMAVRSCGPSFSQNQAGVKSWIDVFSAAKIGSILKHYPDLGSLNADLHEQFATVSAGLESTVSLETALNTTSAIGIMTSHPGTTRDPGTPCSQSQTCLANLRQGTEKLLFSDGLEMTAAQQRPDGQAVDPLQIAKAALEAGNDVLVYGPQSNRFFTLLLDGLELEYDSNPSFQKVVDSHVLRIVGYKYQQQSGTP